MQTKKKSLAGRKKLDASEQKVAVTIWVKRKHKLAAKEEVTPIELTYLSKP